MQSAISVLDGKIDFFRNSDIQKKDAMGLYLGQNGSQLVCPAMDHIALPGMVSKLNNLSNVPAQVLVSMLLNAENNISDLVQHILQRQDTASDADWAAVSGKLDKVKEILEEAAGYVKPNFFAMGYYVTFSYRQICQNPYISSYSPPSYRCPGPDPCTG